MLKTARGRRDSSRFGVDTGAEVGMVREIRRKGIGVDLLDGDDGSGHIVEDLTGQ
jgi:hypothetical protein